MLMDIDLSDVLVVREMLLPAIRVSSSVDDAAVKSDCPDIAMVFQTFWSELGEMLVIFVPSILMPLPASRTTAPVFS